jgi:protein disulfide-isomerase-like protein
MKLIKVNAKNKGKFEECATKDKPMLVLFFANWCPHCQMFEPTWKKLVGELEKDRTINIAEVEYENMEHVPKKYKKIRGFPTLQMIKGGRVISEYNGLRTQDSIQEYVNRYSK